MTTLKSPCSPSTTRVNSRMFRMPTSGIWFPTCSEYLERDALSSHVPSRRSVGRLFFHALCILVSVGLPLLRLRQGHSGPAEEEAVLPAPHHLLQGPGLVVVVKIEGRGGAVGAVGHGEGGE